MDLSRRRFLQLGGLSALGAVVFNGCDIPEVELQVQSSIDIPEDTVAGGELWYATLVNQGGAPEGIIVRVMEGRAKKVEGNPDYPMNRGKHSARSEGALQALYHPDRIDSPSHDGVAASWDDSIQALGAAVTTGKTLVITDPLRGQLGKVVSQFVASAGANHAQFEPLSRIVLKDALSQTFDQERTPHFDIKNAKCVLSIGADWLGTWVSPVSHSVEYGEFRDGGHDGEDRGYLIHAESRFSTTSASADRWIPIKPGTEGLLALGIAHVIVEKGLATGDVNKAFKGGASALSPFTPAVVADGTGLTEYLGNDSLKATHMIENAAVIFATNSPAIALGGDSAGAHTNGAFNLAAAYALNQLVGSVGVVGGIQFNPVFPLDVPQSAVGASLDDWKTTISDMNNGVYSTVIVRGADPVYGLPDHLGFKEALQKIGEVIVFTSIPNETSNGANWVLPEQSQLEMWGDDIPDPAPGYPVLGLQQPVVRPFKDARSFGDVILEVASSVGMNGTWALDMQDALRTAARELHKLNRGSVTATSFDDFWVGILQRGGWWDTSAAIGGTIYQGTPLDVSAYSNPEYLGGGKFHLLPFRSVALWEGQNSDLPWLQAAPDPTSSGVWQTWVEISRNDASELDISEGDILELTNNENKQQINVIAYPMPAIPDGVLGVPMGQGHSAGSGRYARDRGVNVLNILSAVQDKTTNAHAWAATTVTLRKTGNKTRMVKLEGEAATDQLEEWPVVLISNH
jgi:anaerobic selenocysteine-containing dehydrogenase